MAGFRRPSISRMLGISAAKARLSRQLGFSITKAAKGKFALTKPKRIKIPKTKNPYPFHSPPILRQSRSGYNSPVVIDDQRNANAIKICISARNIVFPQVCPSCLGPVNSNYYVSFMRPNGEQKQWLVHHCQACVEYRKLLPLVQQCYEQLQETNAEAEEYYNLVVHEVELVLDKLRAKQLALSAWQPPTLPFAIALVIVIGVGLGLLGFLFSIWFLLGIVTVTWISSIPLILYWPQVRKWLIERNMRQRKEIALRIKEESSAAPAVIQEARQEANQRIRESIEEYQSLSRQLASVDRPNKVDIHNLPVEYLGWDNTVHHFAFAHPGYADAFRRANAGKNIWS